MNPLFTAGGLPQASPDAALAADAELQITRAGSPQDIIYLCVCQTHIPGAALDSGGWKGLGSCVPKSIQHD